jgi:peptidyl-prolyl cis-trans isomerase SurA
MPRLSVLAFALLTSALLAAVPRLPVLGALQAAAQTSIVAVVNGEPITSYAVQQRQQLLRLTGVKGNLQEAAIDELIDEKVQRRAAARYGISVSDADVEEALGEIAKRVKLSPSQLGQALGQSGVNIATLRERLSAQIAFSRLVRAQFRQGGGVTEQDLVAALLKDKDAPRAIETAVYDLKEVTLPLPEKPSPADLQRAEARANDLRARFTSCSEGETMIRNTMNVVIRPYGTRMEPELPRDVQNALKDVAVGRLSSTIQGQRGLVMFAVCDKKTVTSTNAAMKALEGDLAAKKGEQFMRQYTRQLRRDATIERM